MFNQFTQSSPGARRTIGLSPLAVLALALLATPRVVLHDLDILDEGTALNALLVFLPPAVWIAVVLIARVRAPLMTLLAVGATYGVLLALGHQLLWNSAFDDGPPRLGGNLSDLDPGLQTVILRVFAVISGVFTGVVVGAISGAVATALARLTGRDRD
ncbi:DUF4235 domain-containing protein [Streptomyces profundus]|uniref:DUF4235 domain-containing protein n=1 Tax=Streptomyces profundus TaxID=2867410 RepID=UPI001D161A68|nr:DUF4235 domain-containing protein [Streptomyces sp. MA3_2.13]UED87758.1 DUF4235 domain-containing protein [Streptomyces sp. MA3_2.13]